MSTRGRKADLKVIEGGMTETPAVPAHIPDAMRSEWLAVVDDLRERQMLTEAMFGTVDAYVMALWNMRKAQEAIDLHGPLIDGGKGILKQNPAVSLLGKAQSTVLRLAAELGLTPAARSRPKMKGGDKGGSVFDRQQSELFDGLMDF
ncbi:MULTISPECIES: phage terminase small subunit P27 family [unclassified Rhizobium]|uniref:phage terminase small subunit P27 family n=1 Tax=unclassified Rhizobium TaxID=2613769 RepID=UPI0016106A20|nr:MULTISPECIES: phage terminase small subunit P27 family [unclassified Rhizobium]MBB3289909.1 P27 family predicted phage terminase small subunit [Rhizobium sp. BK252]MBB3404138.1 P27 family predicted phage terminase small subunit [Rhizobium sp. BK289]MBB3417237.1 P27 family predicted phage terminase small subunit [Rhizobium sp. BK284]MBB3485114.1 P27 family predicted phage terminase small subunit [Rhizobium sp. BK347]